VPYFYYNFGGVNITRRDATGTLSIDAVTTFVWGQVETSWTLRTTITVAATPPPTGGPWFGGISYLRNAERYRITSSAWVAPNAGGANTASWLTGGAAPAIGTTGAFRITYPDTLVNISLGTYTYNDLALHHEIWASDVLPPGIDVDNPIQFSAKPMSVAKGALQTVIDGGGP
jgi:hypothetical protein